MGMDVYGLNPKLKSEKPKLINWDTASEKEKRSCVGLGG